MVKGEPLRDHVAAISCGICNGTSVLDLDYAEDSEAETDANFVMTGAGRIVEVQGTAEKMPFTEEQFLGLLALARKGRDQARRSAEDGGDVSAHPATSRRNDADAHRRLAGRLVIATHNPGKLREMRELLEPYRIEAVSAGELGLAEPEETGASFRDNARIKAAAAAEGSGLPAFADNSGLVVDALDGAPGIHSARWAGPTKEFRRAMETSRTASARTRRDLCPEQRTRISFARCAWPGRTDTWRNSRTGLTAGWSGRRAERSASATTRCSCPRVTRAVSVRCRPRRSTACRRAGWACRIAPALLSSSPTRVWAP